MKIGTDIHGPQRMKLNDFDGPQTFYLAPSLGQKFILTNTLVGPEHLLCFTEY